MARSSVFDERLVAVSNAIKVCEHVTAPPLGAPEIDWIQFYNGNIKARTAYVGPIAVRQVEGRGLGLVATCRVNAGDVLLIESAFALSSTHNAPISQTTAELAAACCKKLDNLKTPLLEKMTFWCLSQSNCKNSWADVGVRKKIFEQYFAKLNSDEVEEESLQSLQSVPGAPSEKPEAVASIVSSNSRKTESWNSWTLLLDESEALGGLWLGASLFNHACLANVVVSYGSSKDC